MKNKIVNYFVAQIKDKTPYAFRSPVTMDADTARCLIEKQLRKSREELQGNVFHVCYDCDSKIIYLPNAEKFSKETRSDLLNFAKHRIVKDYSDFAYRMPIEGSPFSSIRVRNVSSFSHAYDLIKKHCGEENFKDLPVIEANLAKMPLTIKSLPDEYSEYDELVGSYIGTSFAKSIKFFDEIYSNGQRRETPVLLVNQKTPFILINMAKTKKREEPTANEKEWVVLSGYRDYLYDENESNVKNNMKDIDSFADLYAIKRHLYLGWSFEEVCYLFMGSAKSFGELMKSIERITRSVDSLVDDGYDNLASYPYYITFKIGDDFPFDFSRMIKSDGSIDLSRQYEKFSVVDYDSGNNYITIKTPVYLTQDLCKRVLKAKTQPFICKYNKVVEKADIKGDCGGYNDLRNNRKQLEKILNFIKTDIGVDKIVFRMGKIASGESYTDPYVYNVRKISDYLYATDFIKDMCKKYKVEFKDFDVVVGPIEMAFGQGVQGGYMDKELFRKNKWDMPKELSKGVYISPPIVFINSVTNPSYAKQTETLIHEYRHYIYGVQNPYYEITYKSPENSKDYKAWFDYLQDKNEIEAHKEEIKFILGIGKSYDEIIRDKVGGKITLDNYPIALKFSEMVKDVVGEMEKTTKEML